MERGGVHRVEQPPDVGEIDLEHVRRPCPVRLPRPHAAVSGVGTGGGSLPNTATYKVGSSTSVSMVATSSPPMMAKAIGPQNTVGAIGRRPRMVDIAASIIGRMRPVAEAMTAS